MSHDLIDDLLQPLNRVVTPDINTLKEIIIISGIPGKTDNLRYLGFNRSIIEDNKRKIEFSVVAVINNQRVSHWRLRGRLKKISQLIFNTLWTRNPLDLFLNALRCNPIIIDILAAADTNYTLLGIINEERIKGTGRFRHSFWRIRPVVAVQGLDAESLKAVSDFEQANEIRKMTIWGIPLYRRIGR